MTTTTRRITEKELTMIKEVQTILEKSGIKLSQAEISELITKYTLDHLDDFFEQYKHLFRWSRPKAGAIAFPRIITGESVEKFCSDLRKTESVLLMPSINYNFGDYHFRIGFGRKNMPEGLKKLEKFVANHY